MAKRKWTRDDLNAAQQATERRMLAFSVRQPWATLLMTGEKTVETRKHLYPRLASRLASGQRVFVGFHASRSWGPSQREAVNRDAVISDALSRHGITLDSATHQTMPRGVMIGVGELERIAPAEDEHARLIAASRAREVHMGDYGPGRWCYVLKNFWSVNSLDVFVAGQLGLWRMLPNDERRLLIAIQHHDNLPDRLTSDDLLSAAVKDMQARRAASERVDDFLAMLTGRRCAVARSPIDIAIDRAVGR